MINSHRLRDNSKFALISHNFLRKGPIYLIILIVICDSEVFSVPLMDLLKNFLFLYFGCLAQKTSVLNYSIISYASFELFPAQFILSSIKDPHSSRYHHSSMDDLRFQKYSTYELDQRLAQKLINLLIMVKIQISFNVGSKIYQCSSKQ